MSKNKKIKVLLIVENFLLLIPVFTTIKVDGIQSHIDDSIQYSMSRFLELQRAENSISDSRLEFIEMMTLKEKLQLSTDQKNQFKKNLEGVNSRYDDKISSYKSLLEEYRKSEAGVSTDIVQNRRIKNIYDFFGLVAIIAAFIVNVWTIYKYTKEN